jgi:hypothetical protein
MSWERVRNSDESGDRGTLWTVERAVRAEEQDAVQPGGVGGSGRIPAPVAVLPEPESGRGRAPRPLESVHVPEGGFP